MKVAVVLIAIDFETRLKNKDGAFLKQQERFKMANVLNAINEWVSISVHVPDVTVITAYPEIYELCVRRHVKVILNEFIDITPLNVFRQAFLNIEKTKYDGYLFASAGEENMIYPEILEDLCNLFVKHNGDPISVRMDGKPVLPIIISHEHQNKINGMFDKSGKKIIIKKPLPSMEYLDMNQKFIHDSKKFENIKDYLQGISLSPDGENKERPVVAIAGGGKLGTAVALSLKERGVDSFILEKQTPTSIYQGKSFATAVNKSNYKVNSVMAYLVSPNPERIAKAWKSDAVPVLIDPDFRSIELFSRSEKADFMAKELETPYDMVNKNDTIFLSESDGLRGSHTDKGDERVYAKEEGYAIEGTEWSVKEENNAGKKSPGERYILVAIIDCTDQDNSSIFVKAKGKNYLTIGLANKSYNSVLPGYLLKTEYGTEYGKLIKNEVDFLTHINEENYKDDVQYESDVALDSVSDADTDFNADVGTDADYGTGIDTDIGTDVDSDTDTDTYVDADGDIDTYGEDMAEISVDDEADSEGKSVDDGADTGGKSVNDETNDEGSSVNSEDTPFAGTKTAEVREVYFTIPSPAEGYYRRIKRIGDRVKSGDLVAQIIVNNKNIVDIFTACTGRIAGLPREEKQITQGEIICAVDYSSTDPDDSFSQNPIDLLPGYSVAKFIEEQSF